MPRKASPGVRAPLPRDGTLPAYRHQNHRARQAPDSINAWDPWEASRALRETARQRDGWRDKKQRWEQEMEEKRGGRDREGKIEKEPEEELRRGERDGASES